MQGTWTVVAVVLLAVLVGTAIPLALQAFLALAALRGVVRRIVPRLELTLDEVQAAARRINVATAGIETSLPRAQKLFLAAGDLGESLQRLNRSVRTATAVGQAVGPAIAAAVRTLAVHGTGRGGGETADSGKEPAEESGEGRRYNPASSNDQGDDR